MQKQSAVSPSDVAELIRIARAHGLSELSVQQGSARVEIKLAEEFVAAGPAASQPASPSAPPLIPAPLSDSITIPSPMTGVFYGAATPTDPPFVQPGDLVREGDPIGLIEAMKVFSEVLADRSGRVLRILATNGQLVQQGDALVELAPLSDLAALEPQNL
ncbi:MAG: hypothetical protein LC772_10025 [Chloroflexi bacterium]|nr:hypothetical protein [Chloroflexota bacterium]